MYISIELVQNQSSSVYTFNNVELMMPDTDINQDTLKRVSVHCNGEEYVYVDYSNSKVLPQVQAAIIKITKAFHISGIWQAANITAAIA